MNLFSGKKGEALRAAPCVCKDRPELQCPGQWEPGCDLGNNEKFARAVSLDATGCHGDPGECRFNGACMYHCGRAVPPEAA
jgi:hypothetical protein